MIENLHKELDRYVTIPKSLITKAYKNIRILDQALEVAY